jgi:hypothetical protein
LENIQLDRKSVEGKRNIVSERKGSRGKTSMMRNSPEGTKKPLVLLILFLATPCKVRNTTERARTKLQAKDGSLVLLKCRNLYFQLRKMPDYC